MRSHAPPCVVLIRLCAVGLLYVCGALAAESGMRNETMKPDRMRILLQQMSWHQARHDGPSWPGFNIWTPLGDRPEQWMCWTFQGRDGRRDGVIATESLGAFAAEVRNGRYYYPGSAHVSGTGPNISILEWRTFWTVHPGETVVFEIAHGTPDQTDFWLLGFPSTIGGSAVVTSSAGTVLIRDLDFKLGQTWDAVTQQHILTRFVRVASGLSDGDTVTIRAQGAPPIRVFGAIAVGRAPAGPASGVFDPASITPVMTLSHLQPASNPIRFRFGSSGPGRFFGLGHWTTRFDERFDIGTLAKSHETIVLDSDRPWNPPEGQWLEQVASRFRRRLVGRVQCADEGPRADVGVYREDMIVDVGGLVFDWALEWNTNAEAEGVEVVPGGYGGQWSLDSGFRWGRVFPGDTEEVEMTIAGSGEKNFFAPGAALLCRNPDVNLAAGVIPWSGYGVGMMWVWDYPRNEGFPKIYVGQMPDDTVHRVSAGDVTHGGHRRWVAPVDPGFTPR